MRRGGGLTVGLAVLALAGCGSGATSGSSPTSRPTNTADSQTVQHVVSVVTEPRIRVAFGIDSARQFCPADVLAHPGAKGGACGIALHVLAMRAQDLVAAVRDLEPPAKLRQLVHQTEVDAKALATEAGEYSTGKCLYGGVANEARSAACTAAASDLAVAETNMREAVRGWAPYI
jgi:hypothetical protein